MFNKTLKKRLTELEEELRYQKRFNNEIQLLVKRMCKRLDKLENIL